MPFAFGKNGTNYYCIAGGGSERGEEKRQKIREKISEKREESQRRERKHSEERRERKNWYRRTEMDNGLRKEFMCTLCMASVRVWRFRAALLAYLFFLQNTWPE